MAMEGKGTAIEPLTTSFAGMIIGVSGKLPGKSHSQIKNAVEKLGGRFETLSISQCTHLITAKEHLTTQKAQEAIAKTDCELVSIEWFLKSLETGKAIDTTEFLLTTPKESKKRKANEDPEKNEVRFKKLKDVLLEAEGSTVWIDDEGVILDATLVKNVSQETPGEDTNIFDAVVHRMQIIFNVKTQMCHTWVWAPTSNPFLPNRQYSMGSGDLQSAQENFERTFEQHTGLSWSSRHNDPIKDRFIFIPCCYEDEAKFSPATLSKGIAQLTPTFPGSVINVLSMVFGPNNKVKNTLASLSKGRLKINSESVAEHTIRVGYALLNRICELSKNSAGYPSPVPDTAISLLSRCYFALMFANNRKIPTDSSWVERERELLQYLENVMALDSIVNSPLEISECNMLHLVHRRLQLPEIAPLDKNSKEYKTLAQYFEAIPPHKQAHWTYPTGKLIQILKLDNPGQAERLKTWTEQNKSMSGQRRLLWHGSHSANFIGILSQGLRVNADGRDIIGILGMGIYFSDFAGKHSVIAIASPEKKLC
ncbi:uncharacterized protein N7498_010708 [Penicillium cinerascens]|uniref:Poly [ADP-ribose] polymerase n=1 Tax=Penicillium cinerascens TaxID=70096 RepID=A0A9W9M7G6_9EURO|nr:uncharacterized protein N7498_010708 [Penicillium cinerascens]KAJ5191723.1 hypothetical protein N7498_010708 [Penicillium cinerascens]